MRQKILRWMKQETVLVVAAILALLSTCVVRPSKEYIGYIDFRVLGILWSLMAVMAGFQKNGLFDRIGSSFMRYTRNAFQLSFVLIYASFFASMFITNDVALIAFVPFSIMLLQKSGQQELLLPVIVLQTIAANLGSMLTPIGNPQNLYLYTIAHLSVLQFIQKMLPLTLLSAVLLFFCLLVVWKVCGTRKEWKNTIMATKDMSKQEKQKNRMYLLLFFLCLLTVLRIIPYEMVVCIVLCAVLVFERDVCRQIDYGLLLTFVFFFLFTGNMGKIDVIQSFLSKIIQGREVVLGMTVSQFISNVPATFLLAGFTSRYDQLLIGVNIGSMGTLIASMASLISYKLYIAAYPEKKMRYIVCFTAFSILLLAALFLFYLFFG